MLLGLLVAAIETVQQFEAYCRDRILDPTSMTTTTFADAPSEDAADLVVGHSLLGSPLEDREPVVRTRSVQTTAGDLGRLVAGLLDPGSDRLETGPAALDQLCVQAVQSATGLGLSVHFERTPEGPRMQLAESHNGVGCLVRAYGRTQSGIIVLFNAETGPEAALRIAQLALGGGC